MKAIITGGGTGGHIYPALAIADELKNRGWEILYLGADNRMEAELVPEYGYEFSALSLRPLPRSFSLKIFSSIYYNLKALIKSLSIIKDYKANIVIGTGGFVAGPVVLAASLLRKKTIIHEQNAYPGITNKILAYFADLVLLNFVEAEKHLKFRRNSKVFVTGNPVRKEIIEVERSEAYKKLNLDDNLKTILITGGSQGAEIINKNLTALYKYVLKNKNAQIIHLTGRKNYNSVIKNLKNAGIDYNNKYFNIIDYLNKMEYALKAADLIISRAGATALSEIAVCGIPSILIPFASASENHQLYNAKSLAETGAAVIIEEKELSQKLILDQVRKIIEDDQKLRKMSQAALNKAEINSLFKIIDLIESEI